MLKSVNRYLSAYASPPHLPPGGITKNLKEGTAFLRLPWLQPTTGLPSLSRLAIMTL
jgi:hypothetical protein